MLRVFISFCFVALLVHSAACSSDSTGDQPFVAGVVTVTVDVRAPSGADEVKLMVNQTVYSLAEVSDQRWSIDVHLPTGHYGFQAWASKENAQIGQTGDLASRHHITTEGEIEPTTRQRLSLIAISNQIPTDTVVVSSILGPSPIEEGELSSDYIASVRAPIGANVSVEWSSSDCGDDFTNKFSLVTKFTPDRAGNCTITMTPTGDDGLPGEPGIFDLQVVVAGIAAPTVLASANPVNIVIGDENAEQTNLTASVENADGSVEYSWSDGLCDGVFADENARKTTWRPNNADRGTCPLTVTVSSVGATIQSTVNVSIRDQDVNYPPEIVNMQVPEILDVSVELSTTLSVVATDDEPILYSWLTTNCAGSQFSPITDDGSKTTFTPGTNVGKTCEIKVCAESSGQSQCLQRNIKITAGDNDPPLLSGVSLDTESIDVSSSQKKVRITVTASDEHSGIEVVTASVVDSQSNSIANVDLKLEGGSASSGIWRGEVTIQEGTSPGTYLVDVSARDRAGNGIRDPNGAELRIGADGQDPTLVSVTVSQNPIDLSAGPVTVTINVRATDDKSGINTICVRYRHPDNSDHSFGGCGLSLSQGTTLNGTWTRQFVVQQNLIAGSYQLSGLIISDNAGNSVNVRGEPFVQVLNNNADDVDPALASVTVSPGPIDLRNGSTTVTMAVRATDAGSGVRNVCVIYRHPDLRSHTFGGCGFSLTQGSIQDGVWTKQFTVQGNLLPGNYALGGLSISDHAGNSIYVRGEPFVQVINNNADSVDPVLVSVSASENPIDLRNGPVPITLTVKATDDSSGVKSVCLIYRHPDNPDHIFGGCGFSLVAGTPQNGTWTAQYVVQENLLPGNYRLQSLSVYDNTGNHLAVVGDPLVQVINN